MIGAGSSNASGEGTGRAALVIAGLLLTFATAGCAAPPDAALNGGADRVLYYVSENPQTTRSELEYTAADGAVLGYVQHRRAEDTQAETAIVYLHGIESHAGWFDETADVLCADGLHVYCLDRRGSGINRENRGFASGHVDQIETLFSDIGAFLELIAPFYDRICLTGLSWGGKLALGYALSDPSRVDGLVLITPGLESKVDVKIADKLRIVGATVMSRQEYVKIPIEPEMFTSTPYFLEKMADDPLRLHYATAQFLLESERLEKAITRRISENRLPILLFLAGRDMIIDNDAVLALLRRTGGSLETLNYEDQTHSIQFDAPRRLADDIVPWARGR